MTHTTYGCNRPDGTCRAHPVRPSSSPSLLWRLLPWGGVARRRFRYDLGSEAHIHALFIGDTVLDVASGATRLIEPRQALWLQHGRTIPHTERLIALQGSRQRGGGEVREKGGHTGREFSSAVRHDPLLRAIHGARHAQ